MKYFLIALLIVITSCARLPMTLYKTIAGKDIYNADSKNVFIVTSGLAIDADGSPKAYHQDNKKALDYLANAGKPGNWWALATDNHKKDGNPVIQSGNDPAPGYYVSMTSLQDNTKREEDPNRYVNSEAVPYIVLPGNFSPDFTLGDVALVFNKQTTKKCFAIFADTGPANKIGEGSIYLAEQLGINSSPKNGGASSGIVFILIKKSGNKKVLTKEEIEAIGKSKLTEKDIRKLLSSYEESERIKTP